METTRARDQTRREHDRPGALRWLPAILALFLLAHLVQAHRHQMDNDASMRMRTTAGALARIALAEDGARVTVENMQRILMRCPVAQLVAPRSDITPALPPIGFALLSLLAVAFAASVAGARPVWPPRPPGPARQALLQRFTL